MDLVIKVVDTLDGLDGVVDLALRVPVHAVAVAPVEEVEGVLLRCHR